MRGERNLECATFYGASGNRDDWMPYVVDGRPVDTHGWKAADFTAYVREQNRKFKAEGDGTRLRSVAAEDRYNDRARGEE